MEYRKFNDNKLEASILGFGGWQLGNHTMWNGTTFEDGVILVKEAIKRGINFFDTAPGYANGLSEQIIGEAIKDCRNQVIINTKFGHTAEGLTDFSVESIEPRVLESCKRLQTNYIDSFIIHNPDSSILKGETGHFEELKRIKEKGLIKAYGVSVDSLYELELILEHIQLDVVEIMFNIIHQEPAKAFQRLAEQNISIIVKIPFDSGWLTGKFNKDSQFTGVRSRWSKETKEIRSRIVHNIIDITKTKNLVETALSFIKSYPEVTSIIPGIRNTDHLKSNLEAIECNMSKETRDSLILLHNEVIVKLDTPW